MLGTAVAQWLRCCATNRKVAGSIPNGIIGMMKWWNLNSKRKHGKHGHAKNTDWRPSTWGGGRHITGLAWPVGENPIRKGGNMGTNLPIRCSQWHPTSGNDPHETYSFPYDNRGTPDTHIIRWPAFNLLRLRCDWAHVSCLPKQAWKE